MLCWFVRHRCTLFLRFNVWKLSMKKFFFHDWNFRAYFVVAWAIKLLWYIRFIINSSAAGQQQRRDNKQSERKSNSWCVEHLNILIVSILRTLRRCFFCVVRVWKFAPIESFWDQVECGCKSFGKLFGVCFVRILWTFCNCDSTCHQFHWKIRWTIEFLCTD